MSAHRLEYITDPLQPYFMEIIPPWNKDLIYIIGEAAGGGDTLEFEIIRNHNQWPKGEVAKIVRRKSEEEDLWERTVLEAHGLIYDDWLKHVSQKARDKKLKDYMQKLAGSIASLERYHVTSLEISEGSVTDDDLERLRRTINSLIEAEDYLDAVYSSHGG